MPLEALESTLWYQKGEGWSLLDRTRWEGEGRRGKVKGLVHNGGRADLEEGEGGKKVVLGVVCIMMPIFKTNSLN